MSSSLRVKPPISRQWLRDLVWEVWGFQLQDFQMEILEALVNGGLYTVMLPTDHGKSMLLEMAVCIRLAVDPNRRQIIIKINDDTAQETAEEVCRRLDWMAHYLRVGGAAFDYLQPTVRWAGDVPLGITNGFDIVGIDRRERNVNRSVRGYGLGARGLQGKRGDTQVDDLERQEEAISEAYRSQLDRRLSAIFRTLEDVRDPLWAMFGTPTHEESIYHGLPEKLKGLPIPYKQFHFPIKNDDGSWLWPQRAQKALTHKALMTKAEWSSAYELKPMAGRKLTSQEVEELVRRDNMPWIKNEKQMIAYLEQWSYAQCPPHRNPITWQIEQRERLQQVAFYLSWDPATTGDWAVVVLCIWQRNLWLLRSRLSLGDTWKQALTVREFSYDFPSATLVLEKNAQQKVFKDLVEVDPVLNTLPIVSHGTYANKNSREVGMPAFMERVKAGYLGCPWGDVDRASEEFEDFEVELQRYGPTHHPHLIPAAWFAWHHHHKGDLQQAAADRMEREQAERQKAPARMDLSAFGARSARIGLPKPRPHGAWDRHPARRRR